MGTPAPAAVQKRLWMLMKMFNWNLDELFPHNIDVWMRNPSFYEAGKPKTDTPT